ncbi:hypothetical protein TrRE_jg6528 [Triparma retinervis]|uniref:Uncharacterized protein n=1 Tax=Triparma retinervis TaxID=2557542 RepID=A0A9W7FWX6_9STRA|nr:hypothetical protein TrRE_jg6528 [Triparma retinervis]
MFSTGREQAFYAYSLVEIKEKVNKELLNRYGPSRRYKMTRENEEELRQVRVKSATKFPYSYLPFTEETITLSELLSSTMQESLVVLVAVVVGMLTPGPIVQALHQGHFHHEPLGQSKLRLLNSESLRWALPGVNDISQVVQLAGGGCGLGKKLLQDLVLVVAAAVMFLRDDEPPCCGKQVIAYKTLGHIIQKYFKRRGKKGRIGAVHR